MCVVCKEQQPIKNFIQNETPPPPTHKQSIIYTYELFICFRFHMPVVSHTFLSFIYFSISLTLALSTLLSCSLLFTDFYCYIVVVVVVVVNRRAIITFHRLPRSKIRPTNKQTLNDTLTHIQGKKMSNHLLLYLIPATHDRINRKTAFAPIVLYTSSSTKQCFCFVLSLLLS